MSWISLSVAPGRVTFASKKLDDTITSVTFDLESHISDCIKAKMWTKNGLTLGLSFLHHQRSANVNCLLQMAMINPGFALSTLTKMA